MDEISDETKVGFQRVELLTGPSRRRRWSAEEKARIVAESLMPGARVSEVARRWQLHPQQLFGWRRQARVDETMSDEASGVGRSFVSLVREGEVGVPSARSGSAPSSIEVELAGAVVRVRSGAESSLLTAVLRAVRCSSPSGR
jgi:transposase